MTSGMVVTSFSTSAMPSRSIVRMPWATASRRSSSVVAQPTIVGNYGMLAPGKIS